MILLWSLKLTVDIDKYVSNNSPYHRVSLSNPSQVSSQTWDLSKILHCRILRPKLLHRQFHIISTVLVIKHKNWVKKEVFISLAKILHCRRQWREGQISSLYQACLLLKTIKPDVQKTVPISVFFTRYLIAWIIETIKTSSIHLLFRCTRKRKHKTSMKRKSNLPNMLWGL